MDIARHAYAVSSTSEIDDLIARNAPVAIGVSGGKDSSAVALRVAEHLDAVGHAGPRLLVHSDLGAVEWKDSLPACERLAARLGWELIVVRRRAGDMMERWEGRWANNIRRYADLDCVKLILPWSTPSMRFCTSELKTDVICGALTKRFPGEDIINVTGIRHAESASRSKMPIAQPMQKLSRKNGKGWSWNAIIGWGTDEVYAYLEERKEPLHEAYRIFGSSRVSCAFCIMGSIDDMRAAASCQDNQAIYRRMVDLEIASTFAFQGSRWLGDVAPHLLERDAREAMALTKERAKRRIDAEAKIPAHLLFVSGKPVAIPSMEEAMLISKARADVATAVGISIDPMEPQAILNRYHSLMEAA